MVNKKESWFEDLLIKKIQQKIMEKIYKITLKMVRELLLVELLVMIKAKHNWREKDGN